MPVVAVSGMMRAALSHAEKGRPIFPCSANKKPLIEGGFKAASTDRAQIIAWWKHWPHAYIGMATGKNAGVWVLDIDQHGHDGEDSLLTLCDSRPLPRTIEALTPSGGRHLYFRWTDVEVRNSAGMLGPGLDVRGEGGYVILPPSPGYHWEASGDPDEGAGAQFAPGWLLARVTSKTPVKVSPKKIREGDRNDRLFRYACQLRERGFDLDAIQHALHEKNADECKPPLGLEEVRAIAISSCRYAAGGEGIADDHALDWPPPRGELAISNEELASARLTPKCIVKNYLYADVAQLLAPGGTGKTTLLLYEAVHVTLGRPLWGLEVETRGWVLFVTKEDQRERLVARLREIMDAAELSDDERTVVMRDIVLLDVVGSDRKLAHVRDGNIMRSGMAASIASAYEDDPPALVIFDPLVSFGASEAMVNDNEQALVEIARFLVGQLECCFRYVHHTGKANARDKAVDQYAGRGGSALPDGSRMTAALSVWDSKDPDILPSTCSPDPQDTVLRLVRSKLSYAPPGLPVIWVQRSGFSFSHHYDLHRTDDEIAESRADQIERFLVSQYKMDPCERYTRRSLRDQSERLKMSRRAVESAVSKLEAQGRVFDRKLPAQAAHGARRTYLHPASIGPDE